MSDECPVKVESMFSTPLIRASRTFSRREKDLEEAASRFGSLFAFRVTLCRDPSPRGGILFGLAQGKLRPGEGNRRAIAEGQRNDLVQLLLGEGSFPA